MLITPDGKHAKAATRVEGPAGPSPSSVLHIGDRYDLDVVAARAAGLAAVHLDRKDAGPHAEPARLTSLRPLADYLRSSGR